MFYGNALVAQHPKFSALFAFCCGRNLFTTPEPREASWSAVDLHRFFSWVKYLSRENVVHRRKRQRAGALPKKIKNDG
jgi:hypothetical protein